MVDVVRRNQGRHAEFEEDLAYLQGLYDAPDCTNGELIAEDMKRMRKILDVIESVERRWD